MTLPDSARVLRGRARSVRADRAVTRELLAAARDAGDTAVRVWRPHRHLAFGRRDAASDGYELARSVASDRGFPPHERSVGGRAVAYTGDTVAFALVEPAGDVRSGIRRRYERVTTDLQVALAELGVHASRGEPDATFCPGAHSLAVPVGTARECDEEKVVGIAQRVQRGAALTGGIVIPRGHAEIASVLAPVYDALGVPFDPGTVGSLSRAGGTDDPEAVARTIESALVGEADANVEWIPAEKSRAPSEQ